MPVNNLSEHMKKIAAIISLSLTLISTANAENILTNFKDKIYSEWDQSMKGSTELYVPLHTWHNSNYYDNGKKYNENPIGLGIGKSYLDKDKDSHGFYMMAFSDSHYDIEPMAGYFFTKNFYYNDSYIGVGYTALITARSDMNYIPIPGILPIISVGYDKIKLSGTYVPGGHNHGNVGFFWGTYSF